MAFTNNKDASSKRDLFFKRFARPELVQTPEDKITDSRVAAYVERIRRSKGLPGRVKVNLNTDPKDIPELESLLKLLAEYKCDLCQVTIKHGFRYPLETNVSLDDALLEALKKCPVRKIWGRLSAEALSAVPQSVVDLYLGIGSEKHYLQLSPELSNIGERLPHLHDLQIHLSDHIDTTVLKPLPGIDFLSLFLSNVSDEDVDWVVKAVATMQPSTGNRYFSALRFPQCTFTLNAFKELLEGLKKEGVQSSGLWVSTKNISRLHHEAFTDLTRDILGQELILLSESDMWRF